MGFAGIGGYLLVTKKAGFDPFRVDFRELSVGPHDAASFLADTGLVFSRSTASTVQTSASTVDTSPDVDDACIGDAGYGRGLVIQHNTKNLIGLSAGDASPRDFSVAWTPGTATVDNNYAGATGPDGNNLSSRITVGSNGYAPYADILVTTNRCASVWMRNVSGGGPNQQFVWNTGANNTGLCTALPASTTWARAVISKASPTALQALCVSDCRDYSGVGGSAPIARDFLADLFMFEASLHPTEAIPTGLTFRACDVLSYATGTDLVDTGQLRFYAKFIPKLDSSEPIYYAGTGGDGAAGFLYLLSWDGYVAIHSASMLPYVYSGGELVTGSTPLSWSAYDEVEVYVEVGGGQPTTLLYRVNAGTWTDVSPDTDALADVVPSGAMTIFASNANETADSGQTPSWLQVIEFGGSPP